MQISKGANPKSKSTGSLTGWNGTWRLRSTPQICPTPATLARSDSPGRPLYHRQAWGACGLFLDEKGKLVGRKLYETDNQSNLKSNRYPKDPTPQAKTKVEFLFRAFVSQSKMQNPSQKYCCTLREGSAIYEFVSQLAIWVNFTVAVSKIGGFIFHVGGLTAGISSWNFIPPDMTLRISIYLLVI